MDISKGLEYVKSTPGVLKVFEFVALIISMSCVIEFMKTLNNSRETWDFFLATVVASWLLSLVSFSFFTLGIHKRLRMVNWPLTVGMAFLLCAVLLLIASSILADNTRSYKASGLCDSWASVNGDIECNKLVVAVIFGFVAFVLYSLDSLLHFWLNVIADHDKITSDETVEFQPRLPPGGEE